MKLAMDGQFPPQQLHLPFGQPSPHISLDILLGTAAGRRSVKWSVKSLELLIFEVREIASGKHTKNYGKIHHFVAG